MPPILAELELFTGQDADIADALSFVEDWFSQICNSSMFYCFHAINIWYQPAISSKRTST
jgi:hypothetical protein